MGVVHHANYIVWCELARTRLCLEAGFHYAEIEKRGLLLLVTGVHLSYRAPARYGDTVRAACWVERVSSRGVTFEYRIERADTARRGLDRARLGRCRHAAAGALSRGAQGPLRALPARRRRSRRGRLTAPCCAASASPPPARATDRA